MQQRATAVYVAIQNQFRERVAQGQERGLTTTEIAVMTFILVAIAAVVGGLIFAFAEQQVTTDINSVNTDVTDGRAITSDAAN